MPQPNAKHCSRVIPANKTEFIFMNSTPLYCPE